MMIKFLFNNVLLISLFFWYNKKIFQTSDSTKYKKLILLILILIKSLFSLLNSSQINIILTVIAYLSISTMYLKGSITKKALFIGYFLVASFIAEINTFLLINPIFAYYNIDSTSYMYSFVGITLSTFILISFIHFITKLNVIKNMIETREIWYLIMLPIMSIIMILSIMNSNLLVSDPLLCVLLNIGILFFNIVMCFGFSDIIKSKNSQLELGKFEIQKLHYQLLEEKFDNSRKFIHDFNKHLNIINGLVAKQEYQRLSNYLQDISGEVKNVNNLVITGNQLIDLSINSNNKLLSNHSITIKHDVKICDISPITDLDFNILFSNILENAIESSIKVNGHFIKIKLSEKNDLIILKVINPCDQVNNNFKTTKQNHDYHGFGIKNIERIAKKYNGKVNLKYDEKNKLFITTVYLEKTK